MKQISAYIGIFFAFAMFAGFSLGGQYSPLAFFATPVAHAQEYTDGTNCYDANGNLIDCGTGGNSGYSDPGSSGYDSGNPFSYYGYDPNSYYDPSTGNYYGGSGYSFDTNPSDYTYNCSSCGFTSPSPYDYSGGYTYTPPVYQPPLYQSPVYTPPVYQTPIYNTPIYTPSPVIYPPVQPTQPTCPAGESYQNGVCSTPTVASCPPGQIFTNGVCNTPTVASCPPGQTFANGVCSTPTVASCPAGQTFQNGVCSSPVVAQPTQPIYPQPVYTPPPVYQQPPVAYNNYLPPPVQPQRPYISLSQVPYTGLDLGPVGTVLYWVFLILWTFAGAYLIGVKKIQNTLIPKLKTFFFGTRTKKAPVHTVTPTPAPVAVAATPSFADDFILQQINRARA